MFLTWSLFLIIITQECSSQDDTGPYRGKYIGKLNSYHHQVSGEVYAVDDWTLLLVDFNYDGTGDDTFFWAGDSGRPGPLGFIVPDQNGKTNILERYNNEEIRLKLPDGKKVPRISWFAVYDLASQNAFGDVYIPEEFEAPAPRTLTPFVAAPGVALSSQPVTFLDASTFVIPDFHYDGSGEVYFWTGVGPQPSSRGSKIPDEDGYLEPLRAYAGESLRLSLPGGRTVFEVDWLAVYDVRARAALGAVLVPDALNVPPAPARTHAHRTTLPRCKQLHRDYQVSWEVFGNQITIQLAAFMGEHEYMAFGISGSASRSQMAGADAAVAWFDRRLQRGLATDYNVTAIAPCVQVLGRWAGVCRDERVGGLDSNQVFSASREDGLTVISYRRGLQPAEALDREWSTERAVFVVWALGALDHALEPAFHRVYPRHDVQLVLSQNVADNDCVDFVTHRPGSRSLEPEPNECFPGQRGAGARGGLGARRAVRPRAARVPPGAGPGRRRARAAGAPRRRAAARLVRQRPAGARPAAAPRPRLHLPGQRRRRPALRGAVPPAGDHHRAARRPGAPRRRRAALRARAGRHAPHAPRPPQPHRRGRAVPGRARGGAGRAARRGLRVVPRLQPQPHVALQRRARAAGRGAQLHVARPRLLPLLHARRHGRPHLRGGPPPPQHRPQPRRTAPRPTAATAAAAGAAAAGGVARQRHARSVGAGMLPHGPMILTSCAVKTPMRLTVKAFAF